MFLKVQLFAFSHVFFNLFLQCLEYFIITSRSSPGSTLVHRVLLICTQPFQQARSPTHSPPGSSLVSLPNLSHPQTLHNPQDLTQIPNPNYSSLATLQSVSRLPRTSPAHSLSHRSLPCCIHPFYSARSTPTLHPCLDQETHPVHQPSTLCPPDFTPPKLFPTSRPISAAPTCSVHTDFKLTKEVHTSRSHCKSKNNMKVKPVSFLQNLPVL